MNLKPVYPPLLPAFISICAGILTAVYLPDLSIAVFLTLFILILGVAAYLLRIPLAMAAAAFLAGFWGMGAMSRVTSPENTLPAIGRFSDGSSYTISGRIASFPSFFPRKARYVLACETLTAGASKAPFRVTGKIYLSIYESSRGTRPHPLLYGTRISIKTRLRAIRNFANPGGFDYVRYLRFKGITASAWSGRDRLQVVPERAPPAIWLRIIRQLQKTRQKCHRFILSGTNARRAPTAASPGSGDQAAAVLSAMILGERSGLSQDLRDHFSRAGVSHLLCISGLHLSIIGFFSYLIFLQAFRPFPGAVNRGWARKTALALTLVPLSGYAVLAGFSPATQRALIMASVFITAMLLDRETDPINTLALAGILILALDPAALFSISFQLSFTAVAGIIAGMTLISKKGLLPRSRPMARICTAFWVSLFAGTATFPITAHYFNTASYVFVLSNLILVPVMGLACLPLGLAATVTLFIYPPLARGLLDLALALTSLCLPPVTAIGESTLTWSRILTPTLFEICLYYTICLGLLVFFHGRRRIGKGLMAVAFAAGLCCAGLDVKQRFYPGGLNVTVLDVGQGASTLVQTPGGKIILMDCGGFSSGFDVGRYIVGPYLWRNRILSIDLVVLSHPQADHMNGLPFILDNFRTGLLILNDDAPPGIVFQNLVETVETRHIPVRIPAFPGTTLDYGQVRLSCHPARTNIPSNMNHNSLVTRLVYRQFSMLITGDIDVNRELALARSVPFTISSTVILAPHHGSRTASTKIFLDQVNPESVIVSCGYGNRYGFPHLEALNRYESKGIEVYRTDRHGAVTIRTRGKEYRITPFRKN